MNELAWTEMPFRPDDLSSLAREAVVAATRDAGHGTGWFYAVRLAAAVRFEWSGALPHRALAALARALERVGIDAQDIPGFGVRTGLDVLADVRQAGDHEVTLHGAEPMAETVQECAASAAE